MNTFHFLKLNINNAVKGCKIEDAIKSFCNTSKVRYSFNNNQDVEQFFKALCSYTHLKINDLKEFGLINGAVIAKKIIENKEKLEEAGWKFTAIKSFDKTEMQKEYEDWKQSKNYIAGHCLNTNDYIDADTQELTRTLVIYDANNPGNPDTTFEYDFTGMIGKKTSHQINMIKMDWTYETGLKYYDARPILISNYLKKSNEELAKVELFDDIIGIND